MRTNRLLAIAVLVLGSSSAGAARFGIGINSSLTTAKSAETVPATAATPVGDLGISATGSGTVSLRIWLTERFALEPNIGVALRDTSGGMAAGIILGVRPLYAFVEKKSFRGNVGFDLFFPIGIGGGSLENTIAPNVGPVFGVEYFFDDEKTFSFEVFVGIPITIPVGNSRFSLHVGGNVMAGFHFYLI